MTTKRLVSFRLIIVVTRRQDDGTVKDEYLPPHKFKRLTSREAADESRVIYRQEKARILAEDEGKSKVIKVRGSTHYREYVWNSKSEPD